MEPTKRIIVNTSVQYVRSFIYMVLTLFSTRFILSALGQSDFGLYSVIGSIVMMLGFITNSLASSTQRFLSYTHGLNDMRELRHIFSNALFLHVIIAAILVLLMIAIEPFMMNYLRIPEGRLEAGIFVYYMVTIMIAMTFVTSPIRALYIARENIVYVSVVEIIDAVLRLVGAISLAYISWDSLKVYALLMSSLSVFNLVVYMVYAGVKYDECHFPRVKEITKVYLKKLTGFAVWNVYAVGSTVLRTQGLAIIINRFFGTIINASYGIALQISHAISFIALSILNSINPQLMKAEGRGDRKQMLKLATMESKYSYMILSLVLIPVLIEMPQILMFWLGRIPEYAVEFCSCIIFAFILDQSTIGLTSANQAVGRIRNYTLVVSTIRLMVLPASWICLYMGCPAHSVMIVYILFELLCGIVRIPFLKYTAGLNVMDYCKNVYLRTLIPVVGNIFVSCFISNFIDNHHRFILTECVGVSTGILLIYLFALNKNEQYWLKSNLLSKILHLYKK